MDLVSRKFYSHVSEALSPTTSPPSSVSLHSSHTGFPIIAVALIGILATAFLLIDLLRRFSFSRRRSAEDPLMVHSPVAENRGLNEAAIRSIPVFKFKKRDEAADVKSCECAVCLNEFLEEEKLRVIPDCGHVFHIDCIDVWLQNNANCPLCRTSVSASRPDVRFCLDQILAPGHSPQDPNPGSDNFTGRDEDYVVIEIGSDQRQSVNPPLSRIPENLNSDELLPISSPSPRKLGPKITRKKAKKLSHVSSMGDECIDSRQKDEQFVVQPIRRSFSMDSAADSQLYLAVQEIMQRHRDINSEVISPNEDCSSSSSRVKRSFFSFGQGKGSRSAVQPVELEP
ncbi:UNVERIFIED_CONTAM: RING-H2 finger protein ATL16 [Sesamum latifolium]|uniref:RING-type E3 ubiquitin transferase n=1 Tax=Sesamum latifolium TaxID=2727402 RepID=A0AAW2XYV5_9LAMI